MPNGPIPLQRGGLGGVRPKPSMAARVGLLGADGHQLGPRCRVELRDVARRWPLRAWKISPTAADALAVWCHLQEHYGTNVKQKADSAVMKAAASALGLVGVMERKVFLDRYATTLGSTIHMQYEPGDPSRPAVSQIRLAVHEHQHVVQGRRDTLYEARYLASKTSRATYEAEAWGAELEVAYWILGDQLDLLKEADRLAAKIVNYGCGKEQVAHVRALLGLRIELLGAHGLVESDAAKVAIRFMAGLE